MAATQSNGKCLLCDAKFTKAAMSRHLAACPRRAAGKHRLFHIVVEGRHATAYWMHLEVSAEASLAKLDEFVRGAWLECCGHLSAFRIGDFTYSSGGYDDQDLVDKDMRTSLARVLAPGLKFHYDYDFGTKTTLALRVVAERQGKRGAESVRLVAFNDPPLIQCEKCSSAATQICVACGGISLCGGCAQKHACSKEMFLPMVNSPRTGQCGYQGPGL